MIRGRSYTMAIPFWCTVHIAGKKHKRLYGVIQKRVTEERRRDMASAENSSAGIASLWGRCRTVRARCAHGACTVRARFNVFGMVAQLVPR